MVEKNSIKKRKRGLQTQDNILKISAKLFSSYGYNSVTMRKIASACHIKESSIYNHYSSKEDILDSLFSYFEHTFITTRLSREDLQILVAEKSIETILKTIIAKNDNSNKTIDDIATIIFMERFNHEKAAHLYTRVLIEQQIDYFYSVFESINDVHDLKQKEFFLKQIATNFAYTFMALSNEYAMAKNNMMKMETVIQKMMNALKFYTSVLTQKGENND